MTDKESHEAHWRIIGGHPAWLAIRHATGTIHVLRTTKRGYGKKALHWQITSECGQILWGLNRPEGPMGFVLDANCETCLRVIRERFEHELEYDGLPSDLWDEYEVQRLEEMWRIQAEWHRPDPVTVTASWVGEGELVAVFAGGQQ